MALLEISPLTFDLSKPRLLTIHSRNSLPPLQETVIVSNLLMATDPDYFDDPLLYKPERWLRGEDSIGINPFLVNGFGFGPRMCLGTYICPRLFYASQ